MCVCVCVCVCGLASSRCVPLCRILFAHRFRTLAVVHGVLMSISWVLLLPWGAFVARLRRTVGMNDADTKPAVWFRIHQPVQYVGVILMVVALVIIIVDAGVLTPEVMAVSATGGAHQIVGIIVAVLAVSQPVFAFCRNGCPGAHITEPAREAAHGKWYIAHAVIGFASLVLSMAALILGYRVRLSVAFSIRSFVRAFLRSFVRACVRWDTTNPPSAPCTFTRTHLLRTSVRAHVVVVRRPACTRSFACGMPRAHERRVVRHAHRRH